jgi:hypothetical protein
MSNKSIRNNGFLGVSITSEATTSKWMERFKKMGADNLWAVIQIDRTTSGHHPMMVFGESLTSGEANEMCRKVNGVAIPMGQLAEMKAMYGIQ